MSRAIASADEQLVGGEPAWLAWAKRLLAIAQAGLAYSDNPYDRDRYLAVRSVATDMLAAHVDLGRPDARLPAEELFAETGYPTPKVDVRAYVEHEDKVLLVQERIDGNWSLPGGWADIGSSPAEMAVREVAEESGYQVVAERLLALWDRRRHDHPLSHQGVYKIAVACRLVGGQPASGSETLAVGWFAPGDPPPLSTNRITAGQIRRLAELHRHPELPPDLD